MKMPPSLHLPSGKLPTGQHWVNIRPFNRRILAILYERNREAACSEVAIRPYLLSWGTKPTGTRCCCCGCPGCCCCGSTRGSSWHRCSSCHHATRGWCPSAVSLILFTHSFKYFRTFFFSIGGCLHVL